MIKNVTEQEAIHLLQDGGVGVLPTDTLYGLVARAQDKKAVTRLYALKHRESKPGTLIAASVEQLIELGLSENEVRKVAYLWPNPLSIETRVEGLDYLHQGTHQFAVRVVADKATRRLLEQTGPLMTSSANLPGQPSSTTIKMAREYFGDTVDFYVDNGDLSGRQGSTIIGFKDGEMVIYREGALSKSELQKLIVQHR